MMMKTACMLLCLASVLVLKAQDKTFTDDELTKYATVMVWAENEKASLSSIVSDSVTFWLSEKPFANSLYNDLSAADKKGELESVTATEEELAIYREIKSRIEAKTARFKELYVSKIKEDIGASLYNDLKAALKENEEVKSRYDSIYNQLETGSAEKGGDESENANDGN